MSAQITSIYFPGTPSDVISKKDIQDLLSRDVRQDAIGEKETILTELTRVRRFIDFFLVDSVIEMDDK